MDKRTVSSVNRNIIQFKQQVKQMFVFCVWLDSKVVKDVGVGGHGLDSPAGQIGNRLATAGTFIRSHAA